MIPFHKTIGFRLLLVSFFLLTLPLLIDSMVVLTKRYHYRVEEAKAYLTETAVLRLLPMKELQPIHTDTLNAFIYFFDLKRHFPQKPDLQLSQKLLDLARIGNFDDLTFVSVSAEGKYTVVASARTNVVGEDVTDYFQEPNPFRFREEYGGDVVVYTSYRKTFEPFFVSALGVRSEETEEPIGVIAAVIPAQKAFREMLYEDRIYYPVKYAVILPNSVVVAATEDDFRFQHFHPLTDEELHVFEAQEGISHLLAPSPLEVTRTAGSGHLMEFKWKGKTQMGVMRHLPDSQYTLLAYASKQDIYTLPLRDFLGIYLSYALILVIGSSLVFLISRRWMRAVQNLGSVMSRVEKGEIDARYAPDRWGFQINTLGAIFNAMLDSLLKNKERAERERVERENLARELALGEEAQKRLLTVHQEDLGEIELAESYIPAIKVGGDYYDYFRKQGGQLILAIADASGKGVLACCYSLAARNMLRTLAHECDDIAEVLYRGNNLFCADTGDTGMFVTVQMAQYDYATHTLDYYSLGHNPAVLCRANGEIEWLANRDIAMGVVLKEGRGEKLQTTLNKGDVVVFYTDGVTEAHNDENALFGEERLCTALRTHRHLDAAAIRAQLIEELHLFVGDAQQHDDITLIVVRRRD